ncbi:hypothetical protein BGZ97_004783 [Linnemannia gamsii]|uniref:Uncharacterized protein n=1 Tax=Linnemannia gamsii TaxID=64522 RepID=A0A9P6USX1_9FUNG|nr:hypothetical protein BGZ97_004783 [Linnemannia gamsii]
MTTITYSTLMKDMTSITKIRVNTPRLDKGKGKAIEYQRHDMEDNNVVGDEDMETDGGFETDQYDGYGGDHEQELEPGQDEQGHHVAVEGEEGEGCDEEEYDDEDDGEAPLVRKIRSVQDQSASANATVSLTRVQAAGERRGYKTRIGRDGGRGRHETPHFGARVDVTTDLETMLRAMLLKISICDAYLTPLAPESSFTVVVEMKNNGPGPEAKADFPWSPISPASHEEQLKVSAVAPPTQPPVQQRKLIPVKTVDVADIQLELYLEKFNG